MALILLGFHRYELSIARRILLDIWSHKMTHVVLNNAVQFTHLKITWVTATEGAWLLKIGDHR